MSLQPLTKTFVSSDVKSHPKQVTCLSVHLDAAVKPFIALFSMLVPYITCMNE